MARERRINEIDNVSTKKLSKRKFIDKSMKRNVPVKVSYTEYVADKLVDIYKAPGSRDFFLKCAWNLSEDTIWSAVEDTRKKGVQNPIGLFIYLCHNALKERPVRKARN